MAKNSVSDESILYILCTSLFASRVSFFSCLYFKLAPGWYSCSPWWRYEVSLSVCKWMLSDFSSFVYSAQLFGHHCQALTGHRSACHIGSQHALVAFCGKNRNIPPFPHIKYLNRIMACANKWILFNCPRHYSIQFFQNKYVIQIMCTGI